jgi:hypothetical protein
MLIMGLAMDADPVASPVSEAREVCEAEALAHALNSTSNGVLQDPCSFCITLIKSPFSATGMGLFVLDRRRRCQQLSEQVGCWTGKNR